MSDLDFRRVPSGDFTQLSADVRGDSPASSKPPLRDRVTPAAATAAARVTAPFAERTLTLSNVDGRNSGGFQAGLLQLTSPSDAAEYDNGFTSVADPSPEPEAGRTYVLRTDQTIFVCPNPGALSRTSFTEGPHTEPGPGVGVAEFTGTTSRSTEWTVLDRGTSNSGYPAAVASCCLTAAITFGQYTS